MFWFRARQSLLVRLALALWLLACGLAASQGCLSLPRHDPSATHGGYAAVHAAGHAAQATGCLQFCADSASALSPSPGPDPAFCSSGLPLSLLLLGAVAPAPFASLVLQRPAPPRPPARLRFVRFNA
ncbi:conserved exported hypothetical protein [Pseudomonas sp. 8AS]|uniref:hypothetical protein n=1 Tax=Pseudomonas sp. 8AS TaxID=2653163 RepID=UPI0012F07EB5|nr:hypothetical protein [Pseudomonas sp. 8AS]VXB50401.1 conserved exported hypothetical protein [Pseudomonas sp. 8AS]